MKDKPKTAKLKCDEVLRNLVAETGLRVLRKADIVRYTGLSKYEVNKVMQGVPPVRGLPSAYTAEHVAKVLTGTYKF